MKNQKQHILITGAAGFVGSNLVKFLAANKDNTLHILIKEGTWHPYLDSLDLTVHYGDIRNLEDVRKAMQGCEYVYQMAGVISYYQLDNDGMYSTHVVGVRNILQAALEQKVKKVVVTASTAGIGISRKEEALNEDTLFNTRKYRKVMYMYSKYLTIKLCQEYAKLGLHVCCVSPTTIYGQGDINMHIGKLIASLKSGELKHAPPGGNSVVSVDDIIDGQILVMEKGVSGENYIFANEFIKYYDMYTHINKIINAGAITRLPQWSFYPLRVIAFILEKIYLLFKKKSPATTASLNFLYKNRHFSSRKAKESLGWVPRISFDTAIHKAIAFYEQQGLM